MSEIDNVEAQIRNYYHQRSGRNYLRLMDTPRVWGLPFGQAIMPQAWSRQGDFETALEEVVQNARYRCDISSLNTPDPAWAGIVLGAMDTALSTRMGRTAPTQFRFLFGQTPLYPITETPYYTLFKQALIRLVRDRGHAWERMPDIWLGRFYSLREGFLDALQLKVFGNDSMFAGDGSKMTWNHSKIVVCDSITALAGGHNLNMDLFRSYPPVHDVSAVVHGPGAAGTQGLLDQLWAAGGDLLSQEQLDTAKLTWNSRDPAKSRPTNPLAAKDVAAWVTAQQAALVRWHESNPTPPPTPPPPPPPPNDFHTRDLQQLPELVQDCFPLRVVHPPYAGLTEYKAATGMLALGKYWRTTSDYQDASEIMKKELILGAKRSIKMSQMDLVSAWKKNWSDHHVCQWVLQALLANKDLTVQVVVSPLDAGAGAEGDQYSFGSGAVRTFDLMKYYMTHDVATDRLLPDPGGLRAKALQRLFVAPFYYTDQVLAANTIEGDTYKWPNLPKEGYTATLKQPPLSEEPPSHGVIGSAAMSVLNASGYIYNKVPSAPGNHAKVMIIDDEAYVVGSDNLYPGSLAEFDYLVEGADAVAELLKVYWEPLWKYAGPHARTADNDPPAPVFRLGPAGASGTGTPFDDTSSTQRISSIDVYSGEIVDGIRATHADGTVDPLRGGNGVPPGSATKTTVSFSEADPLVGVSGEWGTWYGGRYITKIRFHQRSGAVSQVFGSGTGTSDTQAFALQAPSPQSQEATGLFGVVAAADNGTAWCLGAVGVVVR
jgi:hypothetical protein